MLVKKWMRKEVITIDINDSIKDATKLMEKNNIRRLPVIKKEKLVGIVTDRDLKEAKASDATMLEVHELLYLITKIKVGEIMTKDPITVPFDFTVEETAEILLKNKISGVPVVDHEGKLIGIITQSDIFYAIISLTGERIKGYLIGFILEDRSGAIKEVTDIIRKFGGRIVSILSSHNGAPRDYINVYIRFYGIAKGMDKMMRAELDKKDSIQYLIDQNDNKREIFEEEYKDIVQKSAASML